MLLRTHLALTILAILLFVKHVNNQLVFILVILIATLLPDIDTGFSTLGRNRSFRFLQFFVRHRGVIHSFTFCFIISLILAVFFPTLSLAFFLGYGLHLFFDSLTKEGIMPFWPYPKKSSWRLRTGSLAETTIFLILLLTDLIIFIFMFFLIYMIN